MKDSRRETVAPCLNKDCIYYEKILRFGDNRSGTEGQYREVECLQCKYFFRSLDNYKKEE